MRAKLTSVISVCLMLKDGLAGAVQDGSSFSECRMPSAERLHRQRHLVYPQLMPGMFPIDCGLLCGFQLGCMINPAPA